MDGRNDEAMVVGAARSRAQTNDCGLAFWLRGECCTACGSARTCTCTCGAWVNAGSLELGPTDLPR
eukprot:7124533-Prymnesium_polylepis.1